MSDGIFLINADESLTEMVSKPYDSEDLLQRLLEKYPQVLAGEQIDSQNPRRWLLVSREIGIPDHDEGATRWSLDHLFLDQDGIPTLIEVKRSTDTRIRREVVGQLLDYASNAVVYWPIEQLRANFEQRCSDDGADPDEILEDFLNGEIEADNYWYKVKTNLQAGRIRMVFVSDLLPPELVRIIEFLNSQMDPAEVLGVQIKQYVSGAMKTLVPRVFGNTSEAKQKKSIRSTTKQDVKPEITDLLETFKKYNAKAYELAGNGKHYKKVMIPGWPRPFHYEFIFTKKYGYAVELHRESDLFEDCIPEIKSIVSEAATKLGKNIDFDPTWSGGKGRFRMILGHTEDLDDVAKSMYDFIEATVDKISQILANQ